MFELLYWIGCILGYFLQTLATNTYSKEEKEYGLVVHMGVFLLSWVIVSSVLGEMCANKVNTGKWFTRTK